MSHTPGPWRLEIESEADEFRVARYHVMAGETELLGNVEDHWYPNVPESLADARLIAAAPDLLQAAQKIIGIYDSYGCGFYNQDEFHEGLKLARAAIAKAEGK